MQFAAGLILFVEEKLNEPSDFSGIVLEFTVAVAMQESICSFFNGFMNIVWWCGYCLWHTEFGWTLGVDHLF